MLRPTDTGQAGFTFDYWDRMQRAGIKVEESAQTSSSSSSRLSPFSRLSGIPEHTLSRRDTLHRKAISKSASRRNCATRSMPRCSFGDPITNQPIFPNIRSRFSFLSYTELDEIEFDDAPLSYDLNFKSGIINVSLTCKIYIVIRFFTSKICKLFVKGNPNDSRKIGKSGNLDLVLDQTVNEC